jgi:hypothetical protein
MSDVAKSARDHLQPKAVMSDAELADWEKLPAAERRNRLRAAIDQGLKSGVSTRTLDEILDATLAERVHAKL